MADPLNDDPPARPRSVTCEFCGCRLAADGSVLSRGDKAKGMMDLDRDAQKLRETVADRDGVIADLKEKLADATKVVKKTSASIFD